MSSSIGSDAASFNDETSSTSDESNASVDASDDQTPIGMEEIEADYPHLADACMRPWMQISGNSSGS